MGRLRRTMLFMPGNNPGMVQNAGILGADSIILDLEDAVSLTEKDSSRQNTIHIPQLRQILIQKIPIR